jgi:hypothetical protein
MLGNCFLKPPDFSGEFYMYRSLLEYDTYAPTNNTATIPKDNHIKATSNFDSCRRVAGLKYLNGEKYLRNSRFSFNPEMMEMK